MGRYRIWWVSIIAVMSVGTGVYIWQTTDVCDPLDGLLLRSGCVREVMLDDYTISPSTAWMVVAPDGGLVAVSGGERPIRRGSSERFSTPSTIRLYRADNGTLMHALSLYDGSGETLNYITNLVFSANSDYIAAVTIPSPSPVTAEEVPLRVWRVADGALLHELSAADVGELRFNVYAVANDGRTALISTPDGPADYARIDMATGATLETLDALSIPAQQVRGRATSPDGARVAIAEGDGVVFYDAENTPPDAPFSLVDLHFSPAGDLLLRADQGAVDVIDIATEQVIWSLEVAVPPLNVWGWLPGDVPHVIRLDTAGSGETPRLQFFVLSD